MIYIKHEARVSCLLTLKRQNYCTYSIIVFSPPCDLRNVCLFRHGYIRLFHTYICPLNVEWHLTVAQIEVGLSLDHHRPPVPHTTARRETSANGRSVAKNAKSGSKTSSNFKESIERKHRIVCSRIVARFLGWFPNLSSIDLVAIFRCSSPPRVCEACRSFSFNF
jgi:hypothetical protein